MYVSIVGAGITLIGVVSPMYYPIIEPYANYILACGIIMVVFPPLLKLYRFLFKSQTAENHRPGFFEKIRGKRANPYSGRLPRKADNILKLFAGTEYGVLSKLTIIDMTYFNPITVQYLMDQLEGRGFVESYIALDPDDNRYVLTEKGRAYMVKRRLLT